MLVYVTAYDENPYVRDFLRLSKLFFDVPMTIDVASKDEPKSSQLIRICRTIDEDYFIILEEDFYLIKPVDVQLVESIVDFCREYEVDRFSLQSKNAHSHPHWDKTKKTVSGHEVYITNPLVKFPFSLEASVWKRSFLLDHLKHNKNDHQLEHQVSNKIRFLPYTICALDRLVMEYRDAARRGRQIIHIQEDPLHLTVVSGWENNLFPEGGSGPLFL